MNRHRIRVVVTLAGVAIALAALAVGSAQAQYFGRNKVQYRKFDFQVLKTEHFDVYYYPEERQAAEQAGRMAERWYVRHSKVLAHELHGRQPLILYASHPDFEQTNAIPGELGEGTGGVTEALKRRIVLPLAASLGETDHVIGHELVHAFQYDLTGQRPSEAGYVAPAVLRLPLWFIEGMAEYLSLGADDPHTAMWMRDAVASNRLPTLAKLDNPRYFPYRYGQAFWAYVAGRWGEESVGQVLKAAGRTGEYEQALQSVLGMTGDSLSKDWHRAIRQWYEPVAGATRSAAQSAHPLVVAKKGGGRLNLGPALSPDGTRLAFLSEKSLFSIEMYLADARSGKIEAKLTKAAVDPHLQSLQFIQSAGAWSPDGRRLAFAAVSKGEPELIVYDVGSGRRTREIPLPGLGEIFHPTWSPDGGRVAFSALVGGFTDLYWYDLGSGELHRLTDDAYADLEPAWSPDGRTLAFVTDRFTSHVDELGFGAYRLALLDLPSGTPRPVPAFDGAKNIDPQWSSDGKSLFFVSDPQGIANVYRVDASGGSPTQVTNLKTGVSGITSSSPAISVARATDRLVFSVYEDGNYNLYSLEGPQALAGTAPTPLPRSVAAGRLPTGESLATGTVATIPTPNVAVPSPSTFRNTDYKARLSLDYIAQPSLAVGAGSSGLVAGGGAALYWSDMLGDHNLATLFQVNGVGGSFLHNLGAVGVYENRKSRWNWGVAGGQIPIATRDFIIDEGTFQGEPAVRERDFRFWEIHRQLEGVIAYPMSRVQRVELSGGFRNIDFASQLQTRIFSQATGNLLSDVTESLPGDSLPSINVGTTSAALVYDNSYFSGTSPILGQRYRLEAGAVVGDLDYYSALADYRRYVPLARALTLAGRVLHLGRYGGGAEDSRLSSLFLGYPSLVRGYNDGSFEAKECEPIPGDSMSCPVFDQLLGSRIAVANVELRVPLLGVLGLLPSGGVPPVELAGFFDAGVAWTKHDEASFLGGGRKPVTSMGTALRVNLLGFAVAEIDFVHPNDRPKKGWYWEFSLTPGF